MSSRLPITAALNLGDYKRSDGLQPRASWRVVVDRVCVWDHSTKMKTHYISARLGIAFAFLVSVLAGVGWLTTRRVSELNRDMKQTINDHWAKVQIAGEALVYSNLNNRMEQRPCARARERRRKSAA